jgi:hypothetical protein
MKNKLAAVIRITIVAFVTATLSMQYDTFAERAGCRGSHGGGTTSAYFEG